MRLLSGNQSDWRYVVAENRWIPRISNPFSRIHPFGDIHNPNDSIRGKHSPVYTSWRFETGLHWQSYNLIAAFLTKLKQSWLYKICSFVNQNDATWEQISLWQNEKCGSCQLDMNHFFRHSSGVRYTHRIPLLRKNHFLLNEKWFFLKRGIQWVYLTPEEFMLKRS